MATEAEQRAAVIAEAREWLRTPFVHHANVKGPNGAVDCAMLLAEVFIRAGVLERFDPRPYTPDWFMHRDREQFLEWVQDKLGGVEVPLSEARPGDVLVYKVGRCYAHGAILVAPELVIHAYPKNRAVMLTETFDPELAKREPRAFDMWTGR